MNINKWFCYVIDYFRDKNVNVFIHGSTLLGAVRNDKLLTRIPFDREINVGIKSTELTLDLIYDMRKTFPFFEPHGDELDHSLIYFGPEPLMKYVTQNKTRWDMEAFGLLAIFWKGKTKWIEAMGYDTCLTWPRKRLDTLSQMNLCNRSVTTPSEPGKWLGHYFGEDWQTEKLKWHWASDSCNRESFKELKKRGEL